jgi:Ca-activated chloride channel family protein
MGGRGVRCNLLLLALLAEVLGGMAQTNDARYSLKLPVDEVRLSFHAMDAHGLPVRDLKVDELRLFDNDRPPSKVLAFDAMRDLPLRAGILMDTSQSMQETRARDREIAKRFVELLLRRPEDQGFVMHFDRLSRLSQGWTSTPSSLEFGIRSRAGGVRLEGSAIFDAVYGACLNQFGHLDSGTGGNLILLFSDGEDNASRSTLAQAATMCQRANTAIYAFRSAEAMDDPTGAKALQELVSETGGRVFRDDELEATIDEELRGIEVDLRSEYRLVYRPAEFQHNGSFHRIALFGPDRVEAFTVRSGYYAPVR